MASRGRFPGRALRDGWDECTQNVVNLLRIREDPGDVFVNEDGLHTVWEVLGILPLFRAAKVVFGRHFIAVDVFHILYFLKVSLF